MPELESLIEQKLIEQLIYRGFAVDVQTRFKDRSGFMEQF